MKVLVLVGKPKSDDLTLDEIVREWEKLNSIENVDAVLHIHDGRLTSEQITNLIDQDTEAVLGCYLRKDLITEELFITHPKLKYIAGTAHGFEPFDVEMTKRYGVTITNTVYGAHTIAEFSFALLMDICHKIGTHDNYMKTHDWVNDKSPKYMFGLSRQIELNELTFGIIGLGNIGFCAAKIANGFGMRVIANSNHVKEGSEYSFIEQMSQEEVFKQADIISLHCPLTENTKNLINKDTLSIMKDGVIIINTARGAMINENDLIDALRSGKVYAAGLDVISEEPPRHDLPILHQENVTITDHIAYLPKTCRLRAISICINNFKSYLEGNPISVINK